MIYGNLRSSFSPTGKEYVTRWNPLASALLGAESQSPLGAPPSSSPRAGEFGSGQSSGAGSGGPDDTTRENGHPPGAAPVGMAAGPAPSMGSPFSGMSHGKAGGLIGAGLGFGFGLPGAGVVGNAIGTAMDVRGANQALDTARANNPQMSAPQLGLGAFLSGMRNNASFGFAGTPVGDSMVSSAISGIDQPGVPGNAALDPDSYTSAQAGGGSGVSDGGGGHASDSYGGGTGDPSGSGAPFYRGGHVTPEKLGGPNPPGPDDGHATLDVGEFVIRASAAEKLGPEILDRLNSGKFKRSALAKALLGK